MEDRLYGESTANLLHTEDCVRRKEQISTCMWRGVSSYGDPAFAYSLGGTFQCDMVAGHAKAGAGSRQIRGVIAWKRQSEQGSKNWAAMGWDATRGSEPEDGLDAAEHEQAAS